MGRLVERFTNSEASLARIEAVQPVNNPFALILAEEARAAARQAERAVMRGDPLGALHGLPVAFKDFTPTVGHRTTRGSAAFEHWVADRDAEIGVTTGCAALAEGTDMGGSVRIPAALCGCVGLKPSLGRIPMDILPTVFDDMSHFGPLARTVAALFLRVAEGPAPADISSQRVPVPLPERLDGDVRGLRIALSRDLGFMAVDGQVAANLEAVAAALEDAGATVTPVDLPWRPELVDAWVRWWGLFLAAGFDHLLQDHR